MFKALKPTLLIFIILYAAITLLFAIFANDVMFHPPAERYQDNTNIIKFPSEQGDEIAAIYLANPKARYTILYSHGNATDIMRYSWFLKELQHHGFAVFAYDYPGYGLSSGHPTESSVNAAIFAAYRYLRQHYHLQPSHIIAMGRSIGTGPTLELATHVPVAAVIVQSGFISAYRVVTLLPYIPFDKFCNIDKINKVTVPLLIMHGTDDQTIPFEHGKLLCQTANHPKMCFWVEHAGHNDLLHVAGNQYWQTVTHFIQLVDHYNKRDNGIS